MQDDIKYARRLCEKPTGVHCANLPLDDDAEEECIKRIRITEMDYKEEWIRNMKEKLKEIWGKLKNKWKSLSKKLKIIIVSAVGVILALAIIITIFMNSSKSDYVVLFPGMDTAEATEVYSILESEGVDARINSDGEIEVPQSQWDTLVYDLAEKGYPQSTPSYGTFFDNLDMTMTDFEKKQTLRFELQDRLQTTIKRIDGVKGAIVTISIPDGNDYVWKTDEEKASATVMLTLEDDANFTSENVSAIKNLVAYSAQKMDPADVKIVNAGTGKEMLGVDEINEEEPNVATEEQRLYYKNLVQQQIEENAEKILVPIYGEEGVTAVASVTLDYDKITQEIKELITNEDGLGVKQNESVEYSLVGEEVDDGGIVGEEDNTDIPSYVNENEENISSDNAVDYKRDTEWAIGYILTQNEKAQGILTDASVSVVVTNPNVVITDNEKDALIQLVKNATNIDVNKISVFSKYAGDSQEVINPEGEENPITAFVKKIFPFIIGLVLLLLLLIAMIIFLLNRRAKNKLRKAEMEKEAQIQNLQDELNEQKRSLVEEAKEHNSQKDMTVNEIKDFVTQNPEITAALIRAMIKEDN